MENEKNKIGVYFFPMAGSNEKNNNNKKNEKKKNGAGWAAAQSRNCIAIQGSVL